MDQKDYVFNVEAVEERLKRVRECIYGCRTPISGYICGKRGVLSDEKIGKLADELIDRMRHYRNMDGASVRFVKLYVYLVARAYDEKAKTFGDIPNILRDMVKEYGSPEKLALNGFSSCFWDEKDGECVWCSARPEGFFGILDRSYEILSGSSIGSGLTEEKLQEIWDRNAIRKKKESADRKAACERYYEKYCEKYEEQDFESLFPGLEPDPAEEYYEYDDWMDPQAVRADKAQRKERWKHSFQDPEKFLEACREFVELFFLVNPSGIADALEKAVPVFLCSEGKIGLGDNETFLNLYMRLDKVCRCAGKR